MEFSKKVTLLTNLLLKSFAVKVGQAKCGLRLFLNGPLNLFCVVFETQ